MNDDRLFLDTVFIQAFLNERDYYHASAQAFLPRLKNAAEVWVTEAVLVEVANALSALRRRAAASFIHSCYHTPNMRVVSVDTILLTQALALYENRADKTWGLTDCISFVVMKENSLTDAVTADHHFTQAGFRALLRES